MAGLEVLDGFMGAFELVFEVLDFLVLLGRGLDGGLEGFDRDGRLVELRLLGGQLGAEGGERVVEGGLFHGGFVEQISVGLLQILDNGDQLLVLGPGSLVGVVGLGVDVAECIQLGLGLGQLCRHPSTLCLRLFERMLCLFQLFLQQCVPRLCLVQSFQVCVFRHQSRESGSTFHAWFGRCITSASIILGLRGGLRVCLGA